jgi:uridine kinase
VRYSGENQADNYYNRSFDIDSILTNILLPIHQNNEFSVELTHLNLQMDKYEIKKRYSIQKDTIILFEGVFLFRKELSPYIDYKIFLDISYEESRKRAAKRDIPTYGEQILEKYDTKYLPAQKKYLKEYPSEKVADLIINNINWEFPIVNNYFHLREQS